MHLHVFGNGPASSFPELNTGHAQSSGRAICGPHLGWSQERVVIGLVHGLYPAAFRPECELLSNPGALVHLKSNEDWSEHIDVAMRLAKTFDARLTGLRTHKPQRLSLASGRLTSYGVADIRLGDTPGYGKRLGLGVRRRLQI
jgi:hypothetical protein